jgi:transmembrane sensor
MNDDMYSLLARYFSGQATTAEEVAVKAWAEQNKTEFEEIEKLWNRSHPSTLRQAQGSGLEESIEFDTDKAWSKVKTALEVKQVPTAKIVRFPAWKKAIAIAALLVITAGLWWFFAGQSNDRHIIADIDGQEVLFDDGSKVYLRKDAGLDHPKKFKSDKRTVSLTGQAFFDIAKEPARPFVITAADAEVMVLGTSFVVDSRSDRVEVIVRTGKVQLSSLKDPSQKLVLEPGDKGVFDGKTVALQKNTDENFDAWQTKKIVFRNTPLKDVINTINNYYKVNIRLAPSQATKLAGEQVTTSFDNQSLQAVLSELELITSFRIKKISGTEYEISGP